MPTERVGLLRVCVCKPKPYKRCLYMYTAVYVYMHLTAVWQQSQFSRVLVFMFQVFSREPTNAPAHPHVLQEGGEVSKASF